MIVTFCGHKEIYNHNDIGAWLADVCRELIREGADTFYLGGYGDYDLLAAQTICKLQREFGRIRSVLIRPYLNTIVDASLYDETLYPPLESVLPRFAISKRNEWMISQSDVVIAYVLHDWGGAAKTLQCARRKHKRVIQYDK